jgi:hypothetical protein
VSDWTAAPAASEDDSEDGKNDDEEEGTSEFGDNSEKDTL